MNMDFEDCSCCGEQPVTSSEGIRCANKDCAEKTQILCEVPLTAYLAWNELMSLGTSEDVSDDDDLPSFTFDVDGYPTEESLKTLSTWDIHDILGCFKFARSGWKYGSDYFTIEERNGRVRVKLSTGGWSGNEDIIGAMQQNTVLWIVAMQEFRRGGHYVFSFKTSKGAQKEKE